MLPTLRRMGMDSAGHKLSEEHSRSSTRCTTGNFHNAGFRTCKPPALRPPSMVSLSSICCSPMRPSSNRNLPSQQVTDTGRGVTRRYRSGAMGNIEIAGVTPEEPNLTPANWCQCAPISGAEFQLNDLKRHVLGYSGYAVRQLPPAVTHSWRFCLQQTPSLDCTGQTPLPADTLNIFRSFGSSYSQNTYLRPWH
ncbi:sperm microtubule inner protein 8 isoform X1 [Pyxicephalus adspersus]|uniref:sperm microtubule inner protein 8 isoform X1 n=1 Tax=Pyxicephalus adspersus TaxID=30357 RepID=UPI003B5AA849